MAIPGPGSPLAVTDIVTEFGGTAPHGISEYYRGGGNVPDSATNNAIPTSGQIALGNFYGSANVVNVNLTIGSNTNNYNLYTQASANPAYVAGASNVTLTVNPGVTVGSSSTGTYALSVPSGFSPGDSVNIVNNGTIVGRGGNGGRGEQVGAMAAAGGAGGHALYINRPVSITNAGVIAGAGGGGGGSRSGFTYTGTWPKSGAPQGNGSLGGNGGGGGAGSPAGSGGVFGYGNPNVAGRQGNSGANGTATSGGSGGARNFGIPSTYYSGTGGNGGARGANGTASEAPKSPNTVTTAGGARGRYITGNAYATWVATGTRLGASS